jgi:hypothetical protein
MSTGTATGAHSRTLTSFAPFRGGRVSPATTDWSSKNRL